MGLRRFRELLQRWLVARNLLADRLFEDFLVSAVASIVGLRILLAITGYPQLAAGGLHIAHVLWGGLGMLLAIVIMLASLSPMGASAGAIVAGVGFGVFIDELGKFVTSDNDYFFEPTFALIYVIFILLYLATRLLTKTAHGCQETRLINVLEILKNGVSSPLPAADHQRARELLSQCDPADPLVQALARTLHQMEISPAQHPGIIARARRFVAGAYERLRSNRWFVWIVLAFFAGHAVTRLVLDILSTREFGQWLFIWSVVVLALLVGAAWKTRTLSHFRRGRYLAALMTGVICVLATLALALRAVDMPRFEFARWGEVASSSAASLVVVVGLLQLRTSRLAAFKAFQTALMILIFLTQFFAFYRSQLTAGVELAANLVIYGVVRYAIDQEEASRRGEAALPDQAESKETRSPDQDAAGCPLPCARSGR